MGNIWGSETDGTIWEEAKQKTIPCMNMDLSVIWTQLYKSVAQPVLQPFEEHSATWVLIAT